MAFHMRPNPYVTVHHPQHFLALEKHPTAVDVGHVVQGLWFVKIMICAQLWFASIVLVFGLLELGCLVNNHQGGSRFDLSYGC